MVDKDELEEAYHTSIPKGVVTDGFVDDFLIYAIGMGIIGSLVVGVLTLTLGTVGIVLGVIVELGIIYLILQKLFATVDELVVSRISRRERQILDELEKE